MKLVPHVLLCLCTLVACTGGALTTPSALPGHGASHVGYFPTRDSRESFVWEACCVDPVERNGVVAFVDAKANPERRLGDGTWLTEPVVETMHGRLALLRTGEPRVVIDLGRVALPMALPFEPHGRAIAGRDDVLWLQSDSGPPGSTIHRLKWDGSAWAHDGSVVSPWAPTTLVHVAADRVLAVGSGVALCTIGGGCEPVADLPGRVLGTMVVTSALLDQEGDLWIGYCSRESTFVRVHLPSERLR